VPLPVLIFAALSFALVLAPEMAASLGIDYGKKNIGLALMVKGIISPLPTTKNNKQLFPVLKTIISSYKVKKIVLGLPLGLQMPEEINIFAKRLETVLKLPVIKVNEVGTTAGLPKLKRQAQKNKDSYSACLILERL